MWHDLLVAVALVMVIEGIMPFLSPTQCRRALQLASQMDDKSLRSLGFASMAVGLVLLYLVR